MDALRTYLTKHPAERVDYDKPKPTEWYWPTTSKRITQDVTPTHVAIDIAGRVGDPAYASTSGVISRVTSQPGGYGTNIRILTDEGKEIILGHLSGIAENLRAGTRVTAGQIVGLIGSTGESTGAHLHFEVREPGPDAFTAGFTSTRSAVDPWEYLKGRLRTPTASTPPLSTFTLTPQSSLRPAASLKRDILRKEPAVSEKPPSWGETLMRGNIAIRIGEEKTAQILDSRQAIPDQRTGKTADDIRVGSMGIFGDITIPKPGEKAKEAMTLGGIVLLAGVVAVVSLGALLGKAYNKVPDPVKTVAGVPTGRQVKAAVKSVKR